jgi:hypothetical protein
MKYALLAYDDGSLDELPTAKKRALHLGHARRHNMKSEVTVVSHYRFRPAQHATTVRFEAGSPVRASGPASGFNGTLRALYITEDDDLDAVVQFAADLPAVKAGATVEIWPFTEPRGAH